ncbi:hypothetical protein [Marinagarivorans algicola]|uniref:hypothetical protein n=1 Tax=Marinagarivorans algicola TaxID=1513270 RepID=UPI0006BA06F8|nr:hypothetical protein [Marinagarivorans algicola]
MLKLNNATVILSSSLGALFLMETISVLIPHGDPGVEKVFIAFTTASLTSYLLRKFSNESLKNEG